MINLQLEGNDMLNKDDTAKMQKLMGENPEFSDIIKKLQQSNTIAISKILHEIRNPLTLISSSIQLIQAQHPEVASYKHWNDVKEDIAFMKQLLNSLSSCNHSGRLKLMTIDFIQLVKSSVTIFEAELKKHKIQMDISCKNKHAFIIGDSLKLKQVIINLLKNAYEAIDKEAGIISISFSCHEDTIELSISDNGCGIDEEEKQTIFTPFKTSKSSGSGLGLAISKQIVMAHHGSLTFTSNKNKGSTFTVTLPIARPI